MLHEYIGHLSQIVICACVYIGANTIFLSNTRKQHRSIFMQIVDNQEAYTDSCNCSDNTFHFTLCSLVTYRKVVIGVTSITRATLEYVRLTNCALLVPMHHNCAQWRLTSRASLLIAIRGIQKVVHFLISFSLSVDRGQELHWSRQDENAQFDLTRSHLHTMMRSLLTSRVNNRFAENRYV